MTSSNQVMSCETCIYGVNDAPMYACGGAEYNSYRDQYDSYVFYTCSEGKGGLTHYYFEPKNEMPLGNACIGCAKLIVNNSVSCHLTNTTVTKAPNDWCGQWQPKGSY